MTTLAAIMKRSGTDPVKVTRDGTILGTPSYVTPQQARGLEVDKKTGIWAFACCPGIKAPDCGRICGVLITLFDDITGFFNPLGLRNGELSNVVTLTLNTSGGCTDE